MPDHSAAAFDRLQPFGWRLSGGSLGGSIWSLAGAVGKHVASFIVVVSEPRLPSYHCDSRIFSAPHLMTPTCT